jgi:hypothetical protein
MELGPDLVALLTRLRELDPTTLDGLLRTPNVAPDGTSSGTTAPVAAVVPPVVRFGVSTLPRTLLEKFLAPSADKLLLHYGTHLPPFEHVFPPDDVSRFEDVLSFADDERPILVVGVMRNNAPELVPLWGSAQHLDPPYARTTAHKAYVAFCRDVVGGNLPTTARVRTDWLVTEELELLCEDVFEAKVGTSPPGTSLIPELNADMKEDLYVPQAALLPSCLVPDLLGLPRDPVAAWRLLRARATELGLLDQCAALWRLLRALASPEHREESCVKLELMDGDAHFVGARRVVLEAILPALGAPAALPPAPIVQDPAGTASLAAAIEAATRPASQKIVTVEEKWPHSYRRLLLLTGVPDVDSLHDFWHDYALQKKAQRWAHVQAATTAMASDLGLEAPTILAKTIEVLDSLVLAGASEDSLSEGLTIWQFPALAPADTDSVNESLRSWEGLLTGATAMSLADAKEILRVGKVSAPTNWLHACVQLEHWTVVLATLLGTGHEAVAWLLSLARLARSKALAFDRQATADPHLPLALLARVHLTFYAFFESVQGGGPALLPDLSTLIRELRERRLVCPRLPPAMQRLLGGASPTPPPGAAPGAESSRQAGADLNGAPVARLQIAPGRNLGMCIRTAATAGDRVPLTDDGRRSFCLAYHFVGRCNLNCGGRASHRTLTRAEEQRLAAWKIRWVDPPPMPAPAPAPAPPPRPPAGPAPPRSGTPRPASPGRPATPGRERP